MVEEVLRAHRDEALRIIGENRLQSREGIELLVRGRLGRIAAAVRGEEAPPSDEQVQALYQEVLDLSYVMFALGYTMANTVAEEPSVRK